VEEIIAVLKSHWSQAGGLVAALAGSISRSGMVVAEGIMNLVLTPVVAFYLLRDWDILIGKIRDLLPQRVEPTVIRLAIESDAVLGAFLKGQFSVMIALGVIYIFGLWLIDLDLALLIGMVAGLISFIPYLGSIVGVVSACIAAIVQFQDVWAVMPVFVVFAVGQTLEGMLLTPWLVGDKVGLHPVAVIFSILAGGQIFGFVGILLALPVASVIMVLMRHVHDLYKDSELYGNRSG
jgi:predicted PurR-regulated permease PerM